MALDLSLDKAAEEEPLAEALSGAQGKLSACDLGGSTSAQVRLQTFSLAAAFSASRPLPAPAAGSAL